MISYRAFRNSDPPALAEVWRRQPMQRGLMQPMSTAILEKHVLSKQYFDRHGLIVAVENDQPIGFAHAGFGSDESRNQLDVEVGVTCMLMVVPHPKRELIGIELLRRCESYLIKCGATRLRGGCDGLLNPFYLGLYGGTRLPGILVTDTLSTTVFQATGYQQVACNVILDRDLSGFRPMVNRRLMHLRRNSSVEIVFDPPAENWWESCTLGHISRTRFDIRRRDGGESCGNATYWDIEPLSDSWGVQAVGLIDLNVVDQHRREGMATHLIGESLRQLHADGAGLVGVQVEEENVVARKLFDNLGFSEIDRGIVFEKVISQRTKNLSADLGHSS